MNVVNKVNFIYLSIQYDTIVLKNYNYFKFLVKKIGDCIFF